MRWLAAIAVFAALVVSACSGSSGEGGSTPTPTAPTAPRTSTAAPSTPSSSPATPTVPADVPTTGPNVRGPGEKPPVEPISATQHTPEGAKAFAEFFIKTIDWAYATTSTTYMRHYFGRGCVGCKSIADAIDRAAQQQRRFIGDRFNITTTSLHNGGSAAAELSALVRFDVSSGEVVDGRGRYVTAAPALHSYQERVDLEWRAGAWTVAELVVAQ